MIVTNAAGNSASSSHGTGTTNYKAMAMVTTLFFLLGFCTVINDTVIPHLQTIFALSYLEASLIQWRSSARILCLRCRRGKLVEWIGYQKSMVVGC